VNESRRRGSTVPAPSPGVAIGGLGDSAPAVTDYGGAGLIVQRLTEHGLSAQVVTDLPGAARGVVFLRGLRDLAPVDVALAVNRQVFNIARTHHPASGAHQHPTVIHVHLETSQRPEKA
jgi:hypothetical protein